MRTDSRNCSEDFKTGEATKNSEAATSSIKKSDQRLVSTRRGIIFRRLCEGSIFPLAIFLTFTILSAAMCAHLIEIAFTRVFCCRVKITTSITHLAVYYL